MPIFIPSSILPVVSGVTEPTTNRDQVIRRSLRLVGAYTAGDNPRPEQMTDAVYALNVMIRQWAVDGLLWCREFVTVPLIANQNNYVLGPLSPSPMNRPTHVFNANRKSSSGNEIPMQPLTRSDWMVLPNKTNSPSPPVQYYYDRQTVNGVLYVWPVPQTGTTDVLVLDVDRKMDFMVDNINAFDMPDEWIEAATYCLALRLAPEYGMPLGERAKIELEASVLFNKAADYDQDLAPIHFGVRRY